MATFFSIVFTAIAVTISQWRLNLYLIIFPRIIEAAVYNKSANVKIARTGYRSMNYKAKYFEKRLNYSL